MNSVVAPLTVKRLAPHCVDLVHHALLSSFWRQKALARFLRQMGVSDALLATFQNETKRQFLDRFFEGLEDSPSGDVVILKIAAALAEQSAFPDLVGWEDSARKIAQATEAVAALRQALEKLEDRAQRDEAAKEARERFAANQSTRRKSDRDLGTLAERLTDLARGLGKQEAGYRFQDWFYDLMDHCDIVNRRPYAAKGRQIDGSITVSGTTYLVETKFTQGQATVTDVDSILAKISTKADNTMGIMVSMSGYSKPAIEGASGPKTPLLLLDSTHVYAVLTGSLEFHDLVERVRRHASQTGDSYLPHDRFGDA